MATESVKLSVPELVSIFERRPQVNTCPTVLVDEWRSFDYDVAIKRLYIISRHSKPPTSSSEERRDSATDNVTIGTDCNVAVKRLQVINSHCNPPSVERGDAAIDNVGKSKRRRKPKKDQPQYDKVANAVLNGRLSPSPCGKGWTISP